MATRQASWGTARAGALAGLAGSLHYPPDLPITSRKDELVKTLREHQVVIVAGETGSGKSTQLPKICLEAGRGSAGLIGHTQPRRIAARSVAERVAEELGVELGGPVGYKVRFTDRVSPATVVKVMTDGVLLAELAGDKRLRAYDTLIVDEAHERSLNIDFVLGYLTLLLRERPDLKVVITSATIDTESFSRHFAGAPVIEVAGRTYPVEIRYRPFGSEAIGSAAGGNEAGGNEGGGGEAPADESEGPADEVEAVCQAVAELCGEGEGDILVFLAGEAEIRDTAEALTKTGPRSLDILPLYGRLSSAEQHRIFEPHSARRVVLSTNVAETSITVPGIRYVVDAGTARISRYSRRTKVQRLPIEPISRASADQRAGRCGRLGPGVCVRLYPEEDYEGRRRFTEPEILRTNLASVVLQMAAIGLGDPERFPFIDPPERRNIKDGIAVLEELGAFAPAGQQAQRLTPVGRRLARLPLDPRLGRMVLEAGRLGCLREALPVVAGLAVQDPRERPASQREHADALHHRFDDKSSDFFSFLALWNYLGGRRAELSSNQFRRLCQRELISYQRAREWQDVHAEIQSICRTELHLRPEQESPLNGERRSLVHQALLAGLATHVGLREGERRDFLGPRGARFALWPGSVLAKKPPRWVMVAELTETGRLWGRTAAPIKPGWLERSAAHLLDWSYSEPVWDADAGEARVLARARLYGLPVVPARSVALAKLGPDRAEEARQIFLQYALVEAGWEGAPEFASRNADLLARLGAEANKARRPAPGGAELLAFYDKRVPPDVRSARTFDAWWRRLAAKERERLRAKAEDLGAATAAKVEGFPDTWDDAGSLPVAYDWEGAGVIVDVPLARFGEVRADLEWQMPGLREDLVASLLRSLPKDLRRELQPIGERAREFVAKAGPPDGTLLDVLARSMTEQAGLAVRQKDFDWSKVPGHLLPAVRVVGAAGEVLAAGKDMARVEADLRPQLERALAEAASSPALGWGPAGRRSVRWDFGVVPRVFEADWHGQRLRGFPALADDGDAVKVAVLPDEASQHAVMAAGTRRLLLLNLPGRRQLLTTLERSLDNRTRLVLGSLHGLGYPTARELADDVVAASLDEVVAGAGGPAWDATGFGSLVDAARRDVEGYARRGMAVVARTISQLYELQRRIEDLDGRAQLAPSLEDARAHLASLGEPGFVSRLGLARLADLERYLAALSRRLERLPGDPARDLALAEKVGELARRLDEARPEHRDELRWLLEELRVSLFAQSLGTKVRVSEARFLRALHEAR